MDEWKEDSLALLKESFKLYNESPRFHRLETAYINLDRANEITLRKFLINSFPDIPQDARDGIVVPTNIKKSSISFKSLFDVGKKYNKSQPLVSDELARKICAIHDRRNPTYHQNFSVSRREYEDAAYTSCSFFESLLGLKVKFSPSPPLSIDMSPLVPDFYIGRAKYARDIKNNLVDLRQRQKNTLIIKGMAGVGKTTLVSSLCQGPDLRLLFPDGVIWLSLTDKTDVDGLLWILGGILRLDFGESKTTEARQDEIKAALSARQLIFVIDNASYYHLDLIKRLTLGGKDCLHIVVTRDADLGRMLVVPSSVFHIEVFEDNESMQLIIDLVGRDLLDNALIKKMSDLAGNNALGLVLIARLISAEMNAGFDPERLILELSTSTNLLDKQVDGEKTLEDIIAFSYSRLSVKAQHAFRQLGVFNKASSGFSEEAMTFVCNLVVDEAHTLLLMLLDRSLVIRVATDRFGIHPIVLTYAVRILSQDKNEFSECVQRYSHYFLRQLSNEKEKQGDLYGIDPDLRNSIEVFDHLKEFLDQSDDSSPLGKLFDGLGMYYARQIRHYLHSHGLWDLLETWDEISIQGSRKAGLVNIEIETLISKSRAMLVRGEPVESINLAEVALDLAENANDSNCVIDALLSICSCYISQSRPTNAQIYAHRAEKLLVVETPVVLQVSVWMTLGESYRLGGQPTRALTYLEKARYLYDNDPSLEGKDNLLSILGKTLADDGRIFDAIDILHQSLKAAVDGNDRLKVVVTQIDIGFQYFQIGKYDEAKTILEKAITNVEQINFPIYLAQALNNLGLVFRNTENYTQAMAVFNRALRVARESNDISGEADALNNIGTVILRQGNPEVALKRLSEAYRLCERLGFRKKLPHNLHEQALTYLLRAEHRIAKGRTAQLLITKAQHLFEQSIDICMEVKDNITLSHNYFQLAQLYLLQQDPDTAETMLVKAEKLRMEMKMPLEESSGQMIKDVIAKMRAHQQFTRLDKH